jgi:hypothetical protein
MGLPIYFLSLPRPTSWATAAGLSTPALPWRVAVGLDEGHRPWMEDRHADSGFLRTPAWVFFHTSNGTGDATVHRSVKQWAKEKNLQYPGNIEKGWIVGFAKLEKVLPRWVWPDNKTPPDPEGENWHQAWEAVFLFSEHHVVRDLGEFYLERKPSDPVLWMPRSISHPDESSNEVNLSIMVEEIWHRRRKVRLE